jgi:hypothetical protein
MNRQANALLSRVVAAGIVLSMLLGSSARAASGPGAAGAEHLTLPIGAKSIAMGEVQAAAIGEPFGWLSNPAALRSMDGLGFGVFHAEWILGTQYDNASFHDRVDDRLSVAAGFVSLRRPDIEGFDESGRRTGLLDNTNYRAIVGLGYSPVPSVAAGLAIKYFREKLDDWTADGIGFDIGALYTMTGLSLGFVAQNVGPAIAFESLKEPLPTTYRGGVSYFRDLPFDEAKATVAFEVVKPRFERVYVAAGAELLLLKIVGVRVGYNGRQYRPGGGLTLGCGVAVRNISVDYAWAPYGDLGSVHRFAVYSTLR